MHKLQVIDCRVKTKNYSLHVKIESTVCAMLYHVLRMNSFVTKFKVRPMT